MKKKIAQISFWLLGVYMEFMKKRGRPPFSKKQENILSALNPGQDIQVVVRNYYCEKVSNIILATFAAVIVIMLASLNSLLNPKLQNGRTIYRNDYGEGDRTLTLEAESNEFDYGTVDISISERKIPDKEVVPMMDEMIEKMKSYIVGDNESLNHIDRDLKLPTSISGYPFELRWSTSDYEIIRDNGRLGDVEADIGGTEILLTAYVTYGEDVKTYEIPIQVFPQYISEEDMKKKELEKAINAADYDTREDDYMMLPVNVAGEAINWRENSLLTLPVMIIVALIVLFSLWKGMDKDLETKHEERNRLLLAEYSELISKLQVLLSSGMTIRVALERIVLEYQRDCKRGTDEKYAYTELMLCIKRLQDGMPEAECYRYFGERCGLLCYRKLSSILIQNIRKGNSGLLSSLDTEMQSAFEERKMAVRKKGEEAQTKLIFPMMIMLGIVMVLIMIPAYMSFGGM